MLTRVLYAADLAEQVANVCTVMDPSTATEYTGPLGNMHFYAQHIKMEVIAGLTESEALTVLKSAADPAKAEAKGSLKALRSGPPELQSAQLRHWCDTTVKTLVRLVIDTHDHHR